MGRKNKKKPKKISAKKQKYLKFKKEKPGTPDISMPELTEEQMKLKRINENKIDRFLRFNRAPPSKSILEKKAKRK